MSSKRKMQARRRGQQQRALAQVRPKKRPASSAPSSDFPAYSSGPYLSSNQVTAASIEGMLLRAMREFQQEAIKQIDLHPFTVARLALSASGTAYYSDAMERDASRITGITVRQNVYMLPHQALLRYADGHVELREW